MHSCSNEFIYKPHGTIAPTSSLLCFKASAECIFLQRGVLMQQGKAKVISEMQYCALQSSAYVTTLMPEKTFLLLLLLLILFFITVIESQQFSTRCVKERIWHYFSLGLGTSFIHLVLALVLQLLVLRYLTLASALASTLTVASSLVALALVAIQSWPWP